MGIKESTQQVIMTESQHLSRHNFYEKRYQRAFSKALRTQYRTALSQYQQNAPIAPPSEPIQAVYRTMYKFIMAREGKLIWNTYVAVPRGRKDLIDDLINAMAPNGSSDMLPFWSNMMDDYLLIYIAERIRKVTETTAKRIMGLIEQGGTREEIIERIRLEDLNPRALTIARTETTNAMSRSQTIALESSGETWEKSWVNVEDDKVRPAHAAMNRNSFIEINDNFIVGGEPLDYPGSMNEGASLGNVANCRCFMDYRRVGGNSGFGRIKNRISIIKEGNVKIDTDNIIR